MSIGDVTYLHHRIVWIWHNGPIPEGLTIDHIDRDPTNDRIENLRLATRSQQQLNNRGCNTNGLPKGVTLIGKRYRAAIGTGVSGQMKHLGMFDTPEEAHAVYCEAARVQWGEEYWRPA